MWRNAAVVLQQCAQVLGVLAGNRVETLVRDRNRAVAESPEEVLDLRGAPPDDDRLGTVRGTECIHKADERGVGGRAPEKPVKVVAQGAAHTQATAMMPGFSVAAFAVEVVGNLSARRADRMAIGVEWAREQTVLQTLGTGASGVDGVEVADVAQAAFGPASCETRDVSAAAGTGVVARTCGARPAARGGTRREPERLRIHCCSRSLLVEDVRPVRPHTAIE